MQSTIKPMAHWTLTIAILATVAIIVSLPLELFSDSVHIPIHLFVAFAAAAVGCGAMWAVMMCAGLIIQYFEDRISKREQHTDEHINALRNSIAEVRLSIGEFAATVGEYGDQRATAARLETLHTLSEPSVASDAERGVTRIGRQASR